MFSGDTPDFIIGDAIKFSGDNLVIAAGGQSVKHAAADIVNAAFHGAVHGFGAPGVIVFVTGGVEFFVVFFVVSFLKEDISTDTRIFEFAVFNEFEGSVRSILLSFDGKKYFAFQVFSSKRKDTKCCGQQDEKLFHFFAHSFCNFSRNVFAS